MIGRKNRNIGCVMTVNESWRNGKIDKKKRRCDKRPYLAKGDRKMLVKRMER